MFRSLLVPLDLSPASGRVVGRVALLPLAQRAQITLLHVVPGTMPPRARRRAEADARKALAAAAASLTRSLPRHVRIDYRVRVGAAAVEIAKRAGELGAELVVMGRGGRSVRDAFLGSTAERVARKSQLPVLVVRLPARGPYRRPALALDLDQAAHRVVELVLRALPPPRPGVEVIHAYDVPFDSLIYPSVSEADAEAYREQYRKKAVREIEKLLASALAEAKVAPGDAPSWGMQVRYGSSRSVIEKAVGKSGADLLVLGTHARAGIAQAFLGTVAGDVLREVACDVLVVPPVRRRRQRARA